MKNKTAEALKEIMTQALFTYGKGLSNDEIEANYKEFCNFLDRMKHEPEGLKSALYSIIDGITHGNWPMLYNQKTKI